ncbi:MAG: hypothetical protein WBQ25_17645 [Nitrososphaeraceae archaeon]
MYCSIFNKRKAISLAVFTVLLLGITTITTAFVNNGNFALAQSRSGPSISANLNDVRNNNTPKQIPLPQQPQKIREYTLIAENTMLEIAH